MARDNTVIVSDTSTSLSTGLECGQPAQTLLGHTGVVFSVAWAGDSRLASASVDRTAVVWETRPEVWIAQNCTRAGRNLTQEEWTQYIPWRGYERTCPQWPEA